MVALMVLGLVLLNFLDRIHMNSGFDNSIGLIALDNEKWAMMGNLNFSTISDIVIYFWLNMQWV